mgnify:CR=1 FL=1
MAKKLILITFIWLVGFAMGNAFWYLASPLWIDRVVSESLPQGAALTALATGQFRDADAAHKGRGVATLYQETGGARRVALTEFQVTNGPDLQVYLVEAGEVGSAEDVLASRWVSLGALKGNIGDQSYRLPDNPGFEVGSVVIWCEQFSVLFSAARLK